VRNRYTPRNNGSKKSCISLIFLIFSKASGARKPKPGAPPFRFFCERWVAKSEAGEGRLRHQRCSHRTAFSISNRAIADLIAGCIARFTGNKAAGPDNLRDGEAFYLFR
jgi:hypothetical protein